MIFGPFREVCTLTHKNMLIRKFEFVAKNQFLYKVVQVVNFKLSYVSEIFVATDISLVFIVYKCCVDFVNVKKYKNQTML